MLDSLEEVKFRLGITGNQYDDFLENQIVLISDAIEGYCNRKFLSTDYEQTFYKEDYNSFNMLELYHFPLQEISEITEDDEVLDPSNYRIHKPSARVVRPQGKGFFFGADITVVKYTAGYDSCPSVVLSVLDSLVQERYNKKIAGIDLNFGSDVQRISIPGAISIDFDYTLNNNERKSAYGTIIGSNANLLDPFRSERSMLGSGKLSYVEVDE